MFFPTLTFAVFFLLVFVGNWLLMPRPTLWKPFILVASLAFYGWWEWRFVALLLFSAAANQLFARAIERSEHRVVRKGLLVAAVATNLVVLGWFKYYGFFVTSVANLLLEFHLNPNLPLLRIVLPVGVSFLTFRVLSYVIDVYRGTLRTSSLLDFAVYVAFFPYIMAGPIARANEFLPQLRGPRNPRSVDTGRAFFLILAGLAKKMLLADYLGTHIVDGVFTTPGSYSSLETLVGIVGYSVQIYCDFSAYSDIAIGVSLLLGFRLPDNFAAPYTAISVQDFWRRWHITLSRWLRDYLYIPLGGSRKGQFRTYANLMVTMLLGGLWHGAGWTFVFWGALHGGALAVEHWRMDTRRARLGLRPVMSPAAVVSAGETDPSRIARSPSTENGDLLLRAAAPIPTAAAFVAHAGPVTPRVDPRPWGGGVLPRLGVFAFVTLAWVFFRATSFSTALDVLAQLFRGWGEVGSAVTPSLLLVIALGIGAQYVPSAAYDRVQTGFSVLHPVVQGAALAVGFLLLDVLGPVGPASFLYYRF